METKMTNQTSEKLAEMVKPGANNAANAVNVNVTIDGQNVAGLVTNPEITGESLVAAGLAVQTTRKAYDVHKAAENARKNWKGTEKAWACNASDGLAVCLDVVGKSAGEIQRANRKISLALAIADESGEALRLTSPNGKPFESTKALFHCLYPNLSDNTIGQYLNVGREIYLRAIRGELTGSLKRLDELEPGTALSAVSALKEAPEKLAAEIAKIGAGKLTQSKVKEAAKAAKAPESAKTVKKEDGTKGTAHKDMKAQDEIARLAKRSEYMEPLFGKYGHIRSDKSNKDEYLFYLPKDEFAAFKNLLTKAVKEGDAAVCLECIRDWFTA